LNKINIVININADRKEIRNNERIKYKDVESKLKLILTKLVKIGLILQLQPALSAFGSLCFNIAPIS